MRLIVAGPGLPMIASKMSRSGPTDPQRIAGNRSATGTAATILGVMSETLGHHDADSLERSSSRRADSIRFGPKAHGVERAEVYFSTCAFEPHRHDTYAIGITTAGVQIFRYRGSRRICLPGQLHVLHPDETHGGAAGTDDGFGYRILYIAPELVRDALAGHGLPFVGDPVQELTPMARPLTSL